MWNLRQLVDKYLELTGGFGKPVALTSFALSPAETSSVFSAFDEDYHISRYLQYSNVPEAQAYRIGGEPVTHISIDASINEIL